MAKRAGWGGDGGAWGAGVRWTNVAGIYSSGWLRQKRRNGNAGLARQKGVYTVAQRKERGGEEHSGNLDRCRVIKSRPPVVSRLSPAPFSSSSPSSPPSSVDSRLSFLRPPPPLPLPRRGSDAAYSTEVHLLRENSRRVHDRGSFFSSVL